MFQLTAEQTSSPHHIRFDDEPTNTVKCGQCGKKLDTTSERPREWCANCGAAVDDTCG